VNPAQGSSPWLPISLSLLFISLAADLPALHLLDCRSPSVDFHLKKKEKKAKKKQKKKRKKRKKKRTY
jgi:hypothetical protein